MIERFGSRGPNEWDTAFDTWETDPALALTLIDRMRAADDDHDPGPVNGTAWPQRPHELEAELRWPG